MMSSQSHFVPNAFISGENLFPGRLEDAESASAG